MRELSREEDRQHRRYWTLQHYFGRFVDGVLDVDWALVSPSSRIDSFDSLLSREQLKERMQQVFGVDVDALDSPYVIDYLACAHRGESPPGPSTQGDVISIELEYRDLLPADEDTVRALLKGVASVLERSDQVGDVAHRLPAVFWGLLGGRDAISFAHWDWLAEDLLNAVREFERRRNRHA